MHAPAVDGGLMTDQTDPDASRKISAGSFQEDVESGQNAGHGFLDGPEVMEEVL